MNRERLLNVAQALRESPNPEKFRMDWYVDDQTGEPLDPFGHYCARADLQDVYVLTPDGPRIKETDEAVWHYEDHVLEHFGITEDQAGELFDSPEVDDEWDDDEEEYVETTTGGGCGGAKTAGEAAQYIEDFVFNAA